MCQSRSYIEESLEYMLQKSTQLSPADYVNTVQHGVMEESHRRTALRWIHEAGEVLGATQRSLHLAISLFDAFLSSKRIRDVRILELIIGLSLSQALKYEESRELSLFDLHSLLHEHYSVDVIRSTELFFIKQLGWDLDRPTADEFLASFFEVTCSHFDFSPLLGKADKYLVESYLHYSLTLRGPQYLAVCAALCVITEFGYFDFRHQWHELVSQRWGITVEETHMQAIYASVSRTFEFNSEVSTDSETSLY